MTKDKKTTHDADDLAAFQEAMHGVKPLKKSTKVEAAAPPTPHRRRARPLDEEEERGFEFSDYEKLPLVASDETIFFAKSGIQHKILRNLRQGQYNAEATLDLHGHTVLEARQLLSDFLLYCKKQRLRHVIIIHGKGRENRMPILKNKLNHWLRQADNILAFCSATVKDGHSGALYVLLRRESFG